MQGRMRIRLIDVLVFGGLIAAGGFYGMKRRAEASAGASAPSEFARAVDLSPLHEVAVQADGRLRSFESHAAAYTRYISGPRTIDGQSQGFTYLDMLFRPERYSTRETVYVKNKLVLAQILDVLEQHGSLGPGEREGLQARKLLSPKHLSDGAVRSLLASLSADLVRTARPVQDINTALAIMRPDVLGGELRILPAPQGATDRPWSSLWDVVEQASTQAADLSPLAEAVGVEVGKLQELVVAWTGLATAWRTEKADEVNKELSRLASAVRSLSPEAYPDARRLAWESWYFRLNSMTWVWLVYLLSVIPLLVAVINRWEGARKLGLAIFGIAFLLQTASVGIRWYVSGRWPNANMFEAVTTSAWFGGVLALILEFVARRSAMKNLFALGSAVVSMAALMSVYLMPATLDSSLNNIMPALHDIWLYIHTNVIIWSYAVIGLAAVTALLFLRQRWCALWDGGEASKLRLVLTPAALAALNVTGWQVLLNILNPQGYDLRRSFWAGLLERCGFSAATSADLAPWVVVGLFGVSATIIVFELLDARTRGAIVKDNELGYFGAPSALLASGPKANAFLKSAPSAAQVFDAATMVTLQLAFIMLWAGIVMGAIWADHSWGRPWGWDPKEVFALNTFIIFLVLVHVRLKVRDKGFWTAVLAILGFETMMFNWIVINFIISGLHSYA